MKSKIVLISILTAACIFVFTGVTWADGKNDRRHKKPKQKQSTVAKQHKPAHQQNQWKKASRYHDKKPQYHKRSHYRAKHQRHGGLVRDYRYKPYYRHPDKRRPYYKPRYYIDRPVKKHRRYKHHRPIYSRTDGNVSILAATSHHGWSIKISSKN
jgi:hypothetical protein